MLYQFFRLLCSRYKQKRHHQKCKIEQLFYSEVQKKDRTLVAVGHNQVNFIYAWSEYLRWNFPGSELIGSSVSCSKYSRISDALVSNVDVVPTILDICRIPGSGDLNCDGKSFLPVLMNQKRQINDSLFLEIAYTRAVVKGNYKYIAIRYPVEIEEKINAEKLQKVPQTGFFRNSAVMYDADIKFPHYYDRDQLYNLKNDPYEQNNLAGDSRYSSVLKMMKKTLREHSKTLLHTFGEFK